MDFAAQRDYYTLKHKQIMIARDVEDTEQHIHRKGEDELRRTKREAENNELRDIEKMIEDKELVSDQKQCGAQNWWTRLDTISAFQETKRGSIAR